MVSSKTIKAYEAYLKSKGRAVPTVDVVRGAWWPMVDKQVPAQVEAEEAVPESHDRTR